MEWNKEVLLVLQEFKIFFFSYFRRRRDKKEFKDFNIILLRFSRFDSPQM